MSNFILVFSLFSSVVFYWGAFNSFRQLGESFNDSFLKTTVCFVFFILSRIAFFCIIGRIFGLIKSDYIVSVFVFIFSMLVPLFVITNSLKKYFKEEKNDFIENNSEAFEFSYRDANGNITLRQVEKIVLLGDRFDAFCKLRMAKRTFVIDRIVSCVVNLQTGEYLDKIVWFEKMGGKSYEICDLISGDKSNKKYIADFCLMSRSDFFSDYEYDSYIKSLPKRKLSGKRIHFTGFELQERHRLEALANCKNMIVSHSVDNNLDYCVIGSVDTPKKEKSFFDAKRLNIPIFDSEVHFFISDYYSENKNDYCLKEAAHYLGGCDILFTGFKRDIRLSLEETARACGMVVRTRVTKNLSYLVCGPKDAPAKRLEAIGVGAKILYGENEFRSLIDD